MAVIFQRRGGYIYPTRSYPYFSCYITAYLLNDKLAVRIYIRYVGLNDLWVSLCVQFRAAIKDACYGLLQIDYFGVTFRITDCIGLLCTVYWDLCLPVTVLELGCPKKTSRLIIISSILLFVIVDRRRVAYMRNSGVGIIVWRRMYCPCVWLIIISAKWTEWNWRIYCFYFRLSVCVCVCVCVCLCTLSPVFNSVCHR